MRLKKEKCRVNHMIFLDKSYLFSSTKEDIRKMIRESTEELDKRELDRKKASKMELEILLWNTEVAAM